MLVLFGSLKVFSQENNTIHCPTGRTYTKPQVAPTFGVDESALQTFFDSSFAQIQKTKCKISLTLLIDSSGKASCNWIDVDTPSGIEEKTIKEIIASMPNWTPGKQGKCDVAVAIPITLELTKKNTKVLYKKNQTTAKPI